MYKYTYKHIYNINKLLRSIMDESFKNIFPYEL